VIVDDFHVPSVAVLETETKRMAAWARIKARAVRLDTSASLFRLIQAAALRGILRWI
jgi:hypothetical protein